MNLDVISASFQLVKITNLTVLVNNNNTDGIYVEGLRYSIPRNLIFI